MFSVNYVILLIFAVVPVAALGYFIYSADKNKEPASLLTKIFFLGFGSALPILIVELLVSSFFPTENQSSFLITFVNTFFGVAIIEESFKWLVAKKVGYDGKHFDEIYDIIVYTVFSSLGFACIENILFVFSYGVGVALSRAIFTIPGHTCFGVVMGCFLARAKLSSVNNNHSLYNRNLILSILLPTLLHTFYDALIFYGLTSYFMIFDIIMFISCFIAVKNMSKAQQAISVNIEKNNIVTDKGQITVTSNMNIQDINYCPVCGNHVHGSNYCGICGYKLK